MLLALLAAAAVAAPGAVETAAPAPATAQPPVSGSVLEAAKAEAAEKFVCRTEQVTGSRFPQKVCRRKADMAQKMQDDQDRMRQQQRSTGGVVR